MDKDQQACAAQDQIDVDRVYDIARWSSLTAVREMQRLMQELEDEFITLRKEIG